MNNIGKRVLSFLCVIVMMLPMVTSLNFRANAAQELDLSKMQIVVPAQQTAVEKTAASELRKYLFNMTGTSVRIVKEGEHQGPAIYLGNTDYAAEKCIVYPTEGDTMGEAWTIQAVGEDLFLCGAPTRGPLYAVYHLLEDVLGVRFWNVWEEEIPFGSAVVPENYKSSGVPAMEFREIFIGVIKSSDAAAYARNRLNGGLLQIPAAYGGTESYGPPAHTHTFNLYFPEQFDASNSWLSAIADVPGDMTTNPEWFAMNKSGERKYNGHLCLTNAGLQQEFAARLIGSIEYGYRSADKYNNARPNYFAIVPPDSNDFCQCPQCLAAVETYGLSGYVLNFVNQMADAVTKAGLTDAILEMLAYAAYRDAPKGGVVPAENVQIRFADSGRDLLHGIHNENNADSLSRLEDWAAIASNNLYNWQYVVNYNNNGVFPSMFYYGDEFTTLMEMGVNGWFAEQEHCINADFWDMKYWLIAKLMEKPVTGEEYTALMDEFIYGYYGQAAGEHIRNYLYYMHERAEATDAFQTFGTHIIGAQWLTAEDIIAGYNHFEKAFAAAGDDATLLRRLRAARSGFDRVCFENFGTWQTQAAQKGLNLPFTKREIGTRLNQTFTEQIAWRSSYDIDYEMYCYRYDLYATDLPALPAELQSIQREHIVEFDTKDFRLNYGDVVVEDPDSLAGKAIRSDGGSRLAAGIKALILTESRGIPVAVYDPSPKVDGSKLFVGTIEAAQIQANQGYQLYRLEWTVPEISANAYMYIFDDWGVQNMQLPTQLQDMVGQTVEICVSMKVEGVINGSDPSQYPVYYIDRVFVLPAPELQQHHYENMLGVCKAACTVCGDIKGNIHTWDEGIVIKEPTLEEVGQKQYTCVNCDATQTATLEKLTQQPADYTPLLIAAGVLLNVAAIVFVIVLWKRRKAE